MRVSVAPDQIRAAFEAVMDDPSFDESRGLWERGRPPVEMIRYRPTFATGTHRIVLYSVRTEEPQFSQTSRCP